MQLSRELGIGAKSRLYREHNIAGCVCNSCHFRPKNPLALDHRMESIQTPEKVGQENAYLLHQRWLLKPLWTARAFEDRKICKESKGQDFAMLLLLLLLKLKLKKYLYKHAKRYWTMQKYFCSFVKQPTPLRARNAVLARLGEALIS